MTETDFLKKCCEYADGFELREIEKGHFDIYTPSKSFVCIHQKELGTERWRKELFPLLLQRAIEGVNGRTRYTIEQYCSCVVIRPINVENPFVEGPDLTKKGALRRVFSEMEEDK